MHVKFGTLQVMSTPLSPARAPSAPLADDAGALRERKKRTTRRALQMAGLTLVAERGVEAVTTEEIAAAAGVSQRTLFNYFTSKEDLLVGNDPDLVPALAAALTKRPAHIAPLEALRDVFQQYAQIVAADQDRLRLRMQVVDDNPSLLPAMIGASSVFGRELARVIADRTGADLDADLYPSLVVNVALTTMRTTLHRYAARSFRDSLTHLTLEAFDAVMAGLPLPRAEEP